jgi:hypothetical protein
MGFRWRALRLLGPGLLLGHSGACNGSERCEYSVWLQAISSYGRVCMSQIILYPLVCAMQRAAPAETPRGMVVPSRRLVNLGRDATPIHLLVALSKTSHAVRVSRLAVRRTMEARLREALGA